MDIMAAAKKFYDLRPGDEVSGDNYRITLAALRHPDRCHAYRVESGGRALVFATDTEHYPDQLDENLLNLSRGADILIYDCQYTPGEYYGLNGQTPRIGWGHSTMQEGVKLAAAAGVKHLILFHHDPAHNDEFIKKLEIEARGLFPNSAAAYEGMEMDLDADPAPRSLFQ
jgi:ribonuclease BN (tRNA processing enzyme)